jgi:hypothetical protein
MRLFFSILKYLLKDDILVIRFKLGLKNFLQDWKTETGENIHRKRLCIVQYPQTELYN